MPRTERQIEEDDVAYAEAVQAHNDGYEDGLAGRPANGDEDHYASGYEDGVADREVDETTPHGTCPYCSQRVRLTSTGKLFTHRVNGEKCVRSGN